MILAAFINWDLIAMSLATVGLAAWAARRHVLAGVLLGLGIATKFYPLVFFGPLLLLCLRAGRMRAFWVTAGSAAAAWLAVNLPVMIAAPSGWDYFYWLSDHRGADWGSIWYFFEYLRWPLLGTTSVPTLNLLSLAAFCLACAGIVVLALAAPRRPRLPQLLFLVLALFLATNKVWSPQYVIWLAPLVVLARPRIWSYALWQVAEIGYFFAIWAYLITQVGDAPGGIGTGSLLHRAAGQARRGAAAVRARGQGHPAAGHGPGPRGRRGRPGRRRPGQRPGPVRAAAAPTRPALSAGGRNGAVLVRRRAARGASGCRWRGRASRRPRAPPPPGPRRAAAPGRSSRPGCPACLSRPEPCSSRELLQCTRSIRPVIALTRSTMPARSSPLANAWQVSRQKPMLSSRPLAMASQSLATASRPRAIARSPPAVFSISIGTGRSIRSTAFCQFS